MLNIKKYVYIIIVSFGLLFTFYSKFTSQYIDEQAAKSKDAITSQNYDYFLRYNTSYNEEVLFASENIVIYEVYNSEYNEYGYNILIFNLEYTYNEEVNFMINYSSSDNSYSVETAVSTYEILDVINIQLFMSYINENIGDTIDSISVSYEQSQLIIEDISVDTSDLNSLQLDDFIDGYSDEEYFELMKINDIGIVLRGCAVYIIFAVVSYFLVCLVYKKVILKQ